MGTRYDHLPLDEATRRAEADAEADLALADPRPIHACRACGWSPPAGEAAPDRCPKCGSGAIERLRPGPAGAVAPMPDHTERQKEPPMARRKFCLNPDGNPNCAGTISDRSATGLCLSCGIKAGKAKARAGHPPTGAAGAAERREAPGPARPAVTRPAAAAPAPIDDAMTIQVGPMTLEARPALPVPQGSRLWTGPRAAVAHGIRAILEHLDTGGTLEAQLHVSPGKVHFGLDLAAEASDGGP